MATAAATEAIASVATSSTSTASAVTVAAAAGAAAGLAAAAPSALSRMYDATVSLVQSAPTLADFFMGESKTRAEEIHEGQRKLEREARRADHKAWMADQQAEAFRAKADARARNPAVQEKLVSGQGDRELERLIGQANRLSGRADRMQGVASNLESASDGIYEVAANVSVLEAATLTTSIIEDANAAMAEPELDADDIAERLTDAQADMKDRTFVIQRALGGQSRSTAQRANKAQMEQYRRQAQQSMVERERVAKASAITPNASRASVERRTAVAETSPLSSSDEALMARVRELGLKSKPK